MNVYRLSKLYKAARANGTFNLSWDINDDIPCVIVLDYLLEEIMDYCYWEQAAYSPDSKRMFRWCDIMKHPFIILIGD